MFNSLTTSFEQVQHKMAMDNIAAMMGAQGFNSPGPEASPAAAATPAREEAVSPAATPIQHLARVAASCAREASRLSLSPAPRGAAPAEAVDGLEQMQEMQQRLDEISKKLSNAQAVMAEQDSLIHAALIGKLPGLPEASEVLDISDNEMDNTFDEDTNNCDFLLQEVPSDDTVFHVRDFLSPASPATMALLGSAGAFWSPAMPQSSKKNTASAQRF
jgi:hypothetical protein